jgi:hypothetical protein
MIQRRIKRERRAALASKTLPNQKAKTGEEPRPLADFMPN